MRAGNNELRTSISGSVSIPGDAQYAEDLAKGFNLAIEHTPEIVVGVESGDDVRKAIAYAAANNLKVAVQATGHGAHEPVRSGMLISTRRLNSVSIDPASRRAIVGAGAQWGAVVNAAAEFGLTPITGSSPTVGVAGYLLGGGVGPLNRSHGYSSDYLEAATLVNGRGEIVMVDGDTQADLLWALRGGKHGFGVVTELVVRLVEMSSLYGGFLMFAEEQIDTAFRSWIDWTATADPQVTTSAAILAFPPIDAIPEPLRGRKLLSLRFAYPGATAQGEQLAAPLRAFAPVFMDTISEMPPSEIARIHSDPLDPIPNMVGGRLLTHVDQEFASVVLQAFGAGRRAPVLLCEVRHMGAASRIDVPEGSAAGGRPAEFTLDWVAADPAMFEREVPELIGRLYKDLAPWIASEGNINFAGTSPTDDDYPSAWSPETFARLAVIRRACDPQGLFAPSH